MMGSLCSAYVTPVRVRSGSGPVPVGPVPVGPVPVGHGAPTMNPQPHGPTMRRGGSWPMPCTRANALCTMNPQAHDLIMRLWIHGAPTMNPQPHDPIMWA